DQAFRAVAARSHLEIQTASLPVPAVSQGRGHRDFPPVEGVDQGGRLTARRPGASDRGWFGDAALVLEDNPGFSAPSVFFTVGQRSPTHWRTPSSFRSRACRAG